MMKKLLLLSLLFTISTIGVNALSLPCYDAEVEIVTNKTIDLLVKENPDWVPLSRHVINEETRLTEFPAKYTILYSLGIHSSRDDLVAVAANSYDWNEPHDVDVYLSFPVHKIITYILIWVNHDQPTGRAYITDGGIGKTYVRITIETQNTYFFDYIANIWAE